ncbi:hypothetical protein [Macrococcoides caseolyticum]|uniref:Uncharacterized protein n=1 Tax=Macrococcus psychrotolerans TaxID=3039389 RepID=A0AAT9P8U9_9STAP|nr:MULTISPECIES: hypothetical protein [Macrococcus]PKD97942.1 hypothetical protein CW719_09670 [Macrococcus caseolyticus]PKF18397.1 hypothetical protein CW717_09670 [Macrococcus caseolyticus]QYA34158.1 hypothetical protein KYI10_12035 [Macrococcus sp. 19Msa1099]QYA38959.1 hypothetical protein KYI07_12015 [Macrococcus caseolyticus]QYA41191.1 hypothetical protein KYI09_11090 [Macrococcus caseolyticus]
MGIPVFVHESDSYTSCGREHVEIIKEYLLLFDNKIIWLHTNSLAEVNEYIEKYYRDKIENGICIIDITKAHMLALSNKQSIKNLIDALSDFSKISIDIDKV